MKRFEDGGIDMELFKYRLKEAFSWIVFFFFVFIGAVIAFLIISNFQFVGAAFTYLFIGVIFVGVINKVWEFIYWLFIEPF